MVGNRWLLAVSLVALLVPSMLEAQPHGTDLLVGGIAGEILRVDPTGRVSTVISSVRSGARFINSLVVDVDNQSLVAVDEFGTSGARLLRIDPIQASVTSVIWAESSGPQLTWPINFLNMDQDGNYLVSTGSFNAGPGHVFKITSGGAFTTYFSNAAASYDSFTEDRTTGNWLLGDISTVQARAIHVLDRRTLTTVASANLGVPSPSAMHQDPHLEDVYVAGGGPTIQVYKPSTNTVTSLVSFGPQANAMVVDRAPDPGHQGALIYTGTSARPAGDIHRFTRQGINLGLFKSVAPAGVLSMVLDQSRNLAPLLIGAPNRRAIRISFPGDTGKLYILAIGASGYTTGFSLLGRHVPLNLDALALLSASGPIPPFLTNNVGFLGAGGIGIVTLDGNPLGPAGKGLRIWVVALSINHTANPITVSQVSAPLLIVLD